MDVRGWKWDCQHHLSLWTLTPADGSPAKYFSGLTIEQKLAERQFWGSLGELVDRPWLCVSSHDGGGCVGVGVRSWRDPGRSRLDL